MKAKFNFGDILIELSNGCKKQFDSEYLSRKTLGFYFEYGDFPEVITGDAGYRYYAVLNILWFKFMVSWVNGSFDYETADEQVTLKDVMDTANTYSVDSRIDDTKLPIPLFPVSA